MRLTPNFSLREFTFSQTAIRRGIDNTPTNEILENIKVMANGMEQVRNYINAKIRVSSGYRSPALNTAIGGSKTSAHMDGFACDFNAGGLTPREVCRMIVKAGIKFDQLILEGVSSRNPDGAWVHISFAPTMRGELLTMSVSSAGRTTYKAGIR